jgi:hypothetical protein
MAFLFQLNAYTLPSIRLEHRENLACPELRQFLSHNRSADAFPGNPLRDFSPRTDMGSTRSMTLQEGH